MTLQIELKADKIVVMTEVFGNRLRIVYREHRKEKILFIPMSIIQAFGDVKTPLELIKEIQS